MTDNLFDRLSDLLRSTGPVNWRLAAELAASVAGPAEPIEPAVADEYRELLNTAHLQVSDDAGLGHFPDLTAEVTDRRSFASEHIRDLTYIAQPVAIRLSSALGTAEPLGGVLTPALIGVSVGVAFGSAAHRATGSFDAPLPLLGPERMVLVAPNVEALAAGAGVDPREARMWAALHEAAHASTLAIPWVRTHVLETVAQYVEGLEVDMEAIEEQIAGLGDPESLQEALQDADLARQLFGGVSAAESSEPLRAVVAAVNGFAGYTASRVAGALVPHSDELRAAHATDDPPPPMLGVDLGDQPGVEFFRDVDRRWGADAITRLWRDPDGLPLVKEFGDPVGWAARVLLD